MSKKLHPAAKVIIPLALSFTAVGYLEAFGAPRWLVVTLLGILATAIPFVVFFLILAESGWRDLSQAFPGAPTFRGPWHTCRTAVMSRFGLGDPEHPRRKVRFSFIVRVGADANAVHIAAPAVVGWLLPRISIRWTAMAATRHFDASGWVTPPSEPGTLFQMMYDPGYRGHFVELEVAEPKYFLQLPAEPLKQALRERSPEARA